LKKLNNIFANRNNIKNEPTLQGNTLTTRATAVPPHLFVGLFEFYIKVLMLSASLQVGREGRGDLGRFRSVYP